MSITPLKLLYKFLKNNPNISAHADGLRTQDPPLSPPLTVAKQILAQYWGGRGGGGQNLKIS
jgi:hypothetical protein